MSLRPEFTEYLRRLGPTVCVGELAAGPAAASLVALRHDVDYSLNLAIECALAERAAGCAASYYILPTAAYWHDPDLVEKCLQLQDLGHEVGLHVNVVTEWFRGETDDVSARLIETLQRLRAGGVRIAGCAAHGERTCYERQFSNYWIFRELRPDNPRAREDGLSPEGVRPADPNRGLSYPPSHCLRRDDGCELPLWSVSLAELGLSYHAMHVPFDRYYTDTGGNWKRSADPLGDDLAGVRAQVLMHPVHWRGPQRVVFFLSTARSGSTWLARQVDTASTATGRHELSLNHRYVDDQLREEKHTDFDLHRLINEPELTVRLLKEVRLWCRRLKNDYAEANVYLEHFLPELRKVFPQADLVHLHRDLRQVVRSLLNRSWYDTPWDPNHFRPPIGGWETMSPFERACWYVRNTTDRLMAATDRRVRLEEVTAWPDALGQMLRNLGFCPVPRLLGRGHQERVNASRSGEFPDYRHWGWWQKAVFEAVCGPAQAALGYPSQSGLVRTLGLLAVVRQAVRTFALKAAAHLPGGRPKNLLDLEASASGEAPMAATGCTLAREAEGLVLTFDGGAHAHVVFGGGQWNSVSGDQGWSAPPGAVCRGRAQVTVPDGGQVELRGLQYDRGGRLVAQRRLGRFSASRASVAYAFVPARRARRIQLALYANRSALPERAALHELSLWRWSKRAVARSYVRGR